MTQAVGMGYELTNGVYRGMQIISGTQECRFLSLWSMIRPSTPHRR